MRPVALAGILASTTILSGCAATIGGISLSSISSFAGIASTLFTGADLGEHAASLVTGKDCRFSEGLVRDDRDVCEEPGSLATRDDFHGIFVERIDADGTVIYAAPKYMPASVGAGENENNPDVIWAQIKAQKAQEESERQVARAQGTQTIDVAALAAGSLSPQSLAFMSAGRIVEAEIVDGETASQRASSTPRPVSNAAEPVAARREVQAPSVEIPFESGQPAIDEKSFTAPIQAANPQGQGGPFIATSASSTPVASTLINGEPVVVLRIGPIFATNAPASAEANNVVTEEANDFTASVFPARPAAPSPLAVLSLNKPAWNAAAVRVAAVEPQLMAARPRTKPAAVAEIVQTTNPKPVRAAPVLQAAAKLQPGDVFQPSSRSDLAFDELPSASAPMQVPGDIPSEHLAIPVTEPVLSDDSEPPPPATSGPAALVPMPQE